MPARVCAMARRPVPRMNRAGRSNNEDPMTDRCRLNMAMIEPEWLRILRKYRYDLERIADPDVRDYISRALRQNGIEVLRGDRGTYQTRDMRTG
jgi:hypothetical protein